MTRQERYEIEVGVCNSLNAQAGRFRYSDPWLSDLLLRAQETINKLLEKLGENMDMDKNEIIERLERLATYAVHTVGELPFVMSLDDGIAIHEAIDMLKSQSEPQWIPCSRELPKEDGQYNVTVKYEHVDGYEDVYSEHGYWVDGHWDAEFGHCGRMEKVLAWMPLPKPWEGEQDG